MAVKREVKPNPAKYPWEDSDDRVVAARKIRGHGRLLREDLRRLPSEYVTDDTDDPDAVHELDAEHIRDNVAEERFEKEQSPEQETPERVVPDWRPVRQDFVDLIGLRITMTLLNEASARLERGEHHDLKHYHLWFPTNDIRVYELRPGNPPADADRPEHLRNIDLVVDPLELKARIKQEILSSPGRSEMMRDHVHQELRMMLAKQGVLI